MKIYKIFLTTFLSLVCLGQAISQGGIHSEAFGKTVFWNKGNVHLKSLKKSMSPSGIYSTAIGHTVFVGNNLTEKEEAFLIGNPPDLVFTGANVDWATIYKDESLPLLEDIFTELISEISGYEMILEESLLLEDRFLQLFRTGTNFGSFVRCTSLETGETMWEQAFNLTNDQKIEIDLSIYLRSDGNVEISGMRLLSPQIPNLFPFALAHRKVLDINTGNLIERIFSDFEDGGVICNNPNGQFGRTFPSDEEFRYVTSCSFPSSDGEYIQIQLSMDETGKIVDTLGFIDNLLSGNNIESHKYIDAYKTPNNNIVIGSSSTSNPTDPSVTFSELIILNPSGEFMKRIDLSDYLNHATFFDLQIVSDKIMISALSFTDFNDPNSFINNLLILDQDGEVILHLEDFKELDGQVIRNFKATAIDNDRYLIASSDSDHCLNYAVIDEDGNVVNTRSACLDDDQWISQPTHVVTSTNGDVITSATWAMMGEEETESFNGAIKMSDTELGITSSNEELEKLRITSLKVYPNPATSELTIKLGDAGTGTLQVYTSLGVLVSQQNLKNQTQIILPIESLQEGIYQVIWQDEHQIKTTSFIKAKK